MDSDEATIRLQKIQEDHQAQIPDRDAVTITLSAEHEDRISTRLVAIRDQAIGALNALETAGAQQISVEHFDDVVEAVVVAGTEIRWLEQLLNEANEAASPADSGNSNIG